MKNDFKGLSEKLAQGMNFDENAVVMAAEVDGECFCFQKGEVPQIAALICMALINLYKKIDDEHAKDVLRDCFIEVLNKEVGIE